MLLNHALSCHLSALLGNVIVELDTVIFYCIFAIIVLSIKNIQLESRPLDVDYITDL